jgi:TolB-like protein
MAQKKGSLALLPFTGGDDRDGESIVNRLMRQEVLQDIFEDIIPVTGTTKRFVQFEQKFQRDSGLTDADTVFEAGKSLNAAFVLTGYITKFGERNLVLVSILDVESLQQIAGDYRTYQTLAEIDNLIPDIAKKLAVAAARDTSKLPGLSVPPFALSPEVNANDAQVLAQIMATNLANGNRYAVLPRTDGAWNTVIAEHQRQRNGETDPTRVKRLGAGRNAQFVLSGSVQKLDAKTTFATDIYDIEKGSYFDGDEKEYTTFADGYKLIPEMAAKLNKTKTERQREQTAQQIAREDEANRLAAQRRAEQAAREAEAKQEAAQRQKDQAAQDAEAERVRRKAERAAFFSDDARLFSIGASVATSFTAPWLIGTVQGTFSLFKYTFVDIGCDLGFIHGYKGWEDIDYHSFYPFAHFNGLFPFGGFGGWYAGLGGGFMMAFYSGNGENNAFYLPAFDAESGFYLGGGRHYVTISYTLRTTTFETVNHKIALGYIFRFR